MHARRQILLLPGVTSSSVTLANSDAVSCRLRNIYGVLDLGTSGTYNSSTTFDTLVRMLVLKID